jgi:segregation and condensation protein B
MNFREFLQITVKNFRIFLNSGTDDLFVAIPGEARAVEIAASPPSLDELEQQDPDLQELPSDGQERAEPALNDPDMGEPTKTGDVAAEGVAAEGETREDVAAEGVAAEGETREDVAGEGAAVESAEPVDTLPVDEAEATEAPDLLPADGPAGEQGNATISPRSGLFAMLESLLFVAGEPVEASQLAKAMELSLDEVEAGLAGLRDEYADTERGMRLQERRGKYALVTMPAAASTIETFLNLDLTTKLSGPALETLAIVAYRQPATRGQIEAVRGVDCAGVLRSLTQRGLVEEMGRLDAVGRPILYGVTDLFMQHFGLTSMEELPPLESKDEDMLWATTKLAELEENQAESS